MCYGCWEEEYGAPKEMPEGADLTVALIRELYSREDGCTGAALHVALDDFNLNDRGVTPFYLDDARLVGPGQELLPDTERTVELCEQISAQLLAMTEDHRAAVVAKAHGWF